MHTLSLLSAAALVALAAGCAGPSKDDRGESVASYMAFEPAVEASVEPAAEGEAPGQADAQGGGEAELDEEVAFEEDWQSHERFDSGLSTRSLDNPGSPYDYDYVVLGMAGVRMLDSDWEPVDEQITGGANFMARGPGGWFHWDVALLYGEDDGDVLDTSNDSVEVEARTFELALGVAKIFQMGIFRPYVGIGAAYVAVDTQLLQNDESVSDDDGSFGGYGRAGVMIEVTESGGLVGFEVRYLVGTSIDLGDVETDVDGAQGYFTIGFSW